MSSELASRLRDGTADPLDDDGCHELPGGRLLAAWIVAELAVRLAAVDEPEPLGEGAAFLRAWLDGGAPASDGAPTARAETILHEIVAGKFGDLYCVPQCCWTMSTAKAYLVASALARRLALAGRKVDTAKRFYDGQNLAEVLGFVDGASPSRLREELRELLARRCDELSRDDVSPPL